MKTISKVASAFAVASLLAGCATTSTSTADRRYSEDNSRAYNLAQAGGLRDARDTALGDAEYSALGRDLGRGVGDAAFFASPTGLGLSSGASIGLGLASSLLSAPGHMQRDSAFAFVPANEVRNHTEAHELIRHHFKSAAVEAARSQGYEAEYSESLLDYTSTAKRIGMSIRYVDRDRGCYSSEDTDAPSVRHQCLVSLLVPPLNNNPVSAPKALGENGMVYEYPATDHNRSMRLTFSNGEEGSLERHAIAKAISEKMPEWFFIYLTSDDNNPPMIFEKGTPELFVTRK